MEKCQNRGVKVLENAKEIQNNNHKLQEETRYEYSSFGWMK
ncbi:hypothetical protein GCWU000282_02308 [Catonella morbi ATCC 51271]|uniref:Uncharacterized protein n=1 Tax=Catonella morbi ATCC 51271 TaxID=592026 RepID=V2XJ50_9FIRM|nr:hypothetical protein GCWU000282_02308 [Catonella morbi ATCC 51271]